MSGPPPPPPEVQTSPAEPAGIGRRCHRLPPRRRLRRSTARCTVSSDARRSDAARRLSASRRDGRTPAPAAIATRTRPWADRSCRRRVGAALRPPAPPAPPLTRCGRCRRPAGDRTVGRGAAAAPPLVSAASLAMPWPWPPMAWPDPAPVPPLPVFLLSMQSFRLSPSAVPHWALPPAPPLPVPVAPAPPLPPFAAALAPLLSPPLPWPPLEAAAVPFPVPPLPPVVVPPFPALLFTGAALPLAVGLAAPPVAELVDEPP